MKKILLFFFIGLILFSCKKDKIGGNYLVTEKFEIAAGSQTGYKGTSKYVVKVSRSKNNDNEYLIEDFAQSYKVKTILKEDSIQIPKQRFPFNRDFVYIEGSGRIVNDTIYYNYFSGGPAGQINCTCVGILK